MAVISGYISLSIFCSFIYLFYSFFIALLFRFFPSLRWPKGYLLCLSVCRKMKYFRYNKKRITHRSTERRNFVFDFSTGYLTSGKQLRFVREAWTCFDKLF